MDYKIWDKKESLITPIGEVLTAEQVKERYPMSCIDGIEFIICDSNIQLGVFMEYEQTKSHYKERGAEFTDKMSKQQVLNAISDYEENIEDEPSTEERVAAAMEYDNLMKY